MAPVPEEESDEEAAEREPEYAQRRKEYEEEQQRKEEVRQKQFEKEQKEREAEQARREKVWKARQASFERILENAPAMSTAVQLRVFLNALVNVAPYSFTDDVASYLAATTRIASRLQRSY
jgi:ParB family chromosome partitioning protein